MRWLRFVKKEWWRWGGSGDFAAREGVWGGRGGFVLFARKRRARVPGPPGRRRRCANCAGKRKPRIEDRGSRIERRGRGWSLAAVEEQGASPVRIPMRATVDA